MDDLLALQIVLDGIFKSHGLMGWKIFPEKSGSIMINIRVVSDKGVSSDSELATMECCRKLRIVSAKQVQRNNDRAKRRTEELSQNIDAKPCRIRRPPDHYTDPRNMSENARSNIVHQTPPKSMPSPDYVMNVTHSPDELLCSPTRSETTSTVDALFVNIQDSASMRSECHEDPKLPCVTDGNSLHHDDGFRRPAPFVQCETPTPITDEDEMIEPTEHEDFYVNIRKLNRCKRGHCLYRERLGPNIHKDPPFPDDHYDWSKDGIFACELCCRSCPKEMFCIDCINDGAHEGHRPWLRTF